MTNKALGGKAPTNAPGITQGTGLYDLGLLARTTGKVTYVGDDSAGDCFFYINDGSALKDGNSLQGAIIVPLNDSAAGTTYPSPVTGVRVYCDSAACPGIGDYVCVTGISSDTQVGANLVRCLRVRGQMDVTYSASYLRCYKPQAYGGFVTSDSSGMTIGSRVRLVNALVDCNYGSYLKVLHTDCLPKNTCTGIWSYVEANTSLLSSAATPASPATAMATGVWDRVTVTGTSADGGYNGDTIQADCIYLGGAAYGATSMAMGVRSLVALPSPDAGGGPFNPYPGPTDAEIIASPDFQTAWNAPGAIGWALTQPDDSLVTLPGEGVQSVSSDGCTIALREWFAFSSDPPALVLVLNNPVPELTGATIDIVGATLTTLAGGQRALVNPQAVYAYVNDDGSYPPPMPMKDLSGLLTRVQIAPSYLAAQIRQRRFSVKAGRGRSLSLPCFLASGNHSVVGSNLRNA